MPTRQQRGFTLIELLVVVAIIGVIAAIAIPNLLNALQRGKQSRTIAQMRTVSTALESYMIDNDIYPTQDSEQPVALIASSLEPTYVRELPRADGWDNDLFYEAFESQRYRLVSLGKDGRESGPEEGPISRFTDDLIMREGDFLTWPEGTQE